MTITTPSENLGSDVIRMDDQAEYERWIQTQGLGDTLYGDEQDFDGDAGRSELRGI